MSEMPRLSETLPGPRILTMCQACMGTDVTLEKWMEHDAQDKPEPIVVVLCVHCAGQLIDPHPRLYRRLHEWEPMPGAMPLCADCLHCDNLHCRNPRAQINGGPGLSMTFPKPGHVHLCRGPGGSGWVNLWRGPVSACNGRELDPPTEETKRS